MPWNEQSGGGQSGGPWGGGPRRPRGQPPREPQGAQGPDLEEMLQRFRDGLRGGGGGRFGGGLGGVRWPVIAGVLGVGWLLTGAYIVDEGERGVITRFSAFERVDPPGLHWHLPPPLEARQVIGFTVQRVIPVGYRDRGQRQEDEPGESSMITGDRNIVDIDFRVVYRVIDAEKYLFEVRDQDETVRGVAESAMREIIGQRQLEPIITSDRASIEAAVEALMQGVLDSYDAGVQVMQVNLLEAKAPQPVIEAFNDVVRAGQDAEAARNRAQQFANERVPRVQGEAAQLIQQAEGYREQAIREAQGESARFTLIYDAYRQSPGVTRERLYLETMERVYRDADTIILDQRAGAVPYLPLENLRRTPGAGATPAPPAAQPGGR